MARRKRYHQSRRDREHESSGMKHHYEDEGKTFASDAPEASHGYRTYHEDSHMIREDHSAPSNLPQHPVIREYPRGSYGLPMYLDDTIEGIDDYAKQNYRRIKEDIDYPYHERD